MISEILLHKSINIKVKIKGIYQCSDDVMSEWFHTLIFDTLIDYSDVPNFFKSYVPFFCDKFQTKTSKHLIYVTE